MKKKKNPTPAISLCKRHTCLPGHCPYNAPFKVTLCLQLGGELPAQGMCAAIWLCNVHGQLASLPRS